MRNQLLPRERPARPDPRDGFQLPRAIRHAGRTGPTADRGAAEGRSHGKPRPCPGPSSPPPFPASPTTATARSAPCNYFVAYGNEHVAIRPARPVWVGPANDADLGRRGLLPALRLAAAFPGRPWANSPGRWGALNMRQLRAPVLRRVFDNPGHVRGETWNVGGSSPTRPTQTTPTRVFNRRLRHAAFPALRARFSGPPSLDPADGAPDFNLPRPRHGYSVLSLLVCGSIFFPRSSRGHGTRPE